MRRAAACAATEPCPQFVVSDSEAAAGEHLAALLEPEGPQGYLEAASHMLGRPVGSIRGLSDEDYTDLEWKTLVSRDVNHHFSRDRQGRRYLDARSGWHDPGNGSAPYRYERGPRDMRKTRREYDLR